METIEHFGSAAKKVAHSFSGCQSQAFFWSLSGVWKAEASSGSSGLLAGMWALETCFDKRRDLLDGVRSDPVHGWRSESWQGCLRRDVPVVRLYSKGGM